jgi:hypothetical protein
LSNLNANYFAKLIVKIAIKGKFFNSKTARFEYRLVRFLFHKLFNKNPISKIRFEIPSIISSEIEQIEEIN